MLWSWGKVTIKPVDLANLAVWAISIAVQHIRFANSATWGPKVGSGPSEPQVSQNWGGPCLKHPQTIGDMTYLAKNIKTLLNYLVDLGCAFFVGCSNFGHEVRSFSAPTKKCRRTALVSFLESIRDAPDSRSRAHSWVRANHQFLWSLHRAVSRGGCSPLPGRRPGKKLQLARAIYSHPWLYPMCTDRVNCILFGYAAFGNHEHLFQDALEKLASPTLVMQQEQTRRDKLLNWLNYSIKLGAHALASHWSVSGHFAPIILQEK